MAKSFYILLIFNLIFFILNQISPSTFESYQSIISLALIALLGIPHGAIDHILFLKKTDKNKSFFFTFYLLFIFVFLSLWIYYPSLSFLLFLAISAYHFGQSQFHNLSISNIIKKAIGLTWGIVVLSALVIVNFNETQLLLSEYADFKAFTNLFQIEYIKPLFFSSLITFLTLLILTNSIKKITKEILYLGLILLTFIFQPLFLGFALFFIFNHSFSVLKTEFKFLSRYDINYNVLKFIKALAPFTLLSLFGIFFIYFLSVIGVVNLSLPFILLITISSLTIPHAIVMEVFYKKLS